MILDSDEKIFLVPLEENRYAEFRFKPERLIVSFLEDYNIPYEVSTKKFKGKKLFPSEQQSLFLYKIPFKNGKGVYQFFFTSNIIDSILKYYNVSFKKGMMSGE